MTPQQKIDEIWDSFDKAIKLRVEIPEAQEREERLRQIGFPAKICTDSAHEKYFGSSLVKGQVNNVLILGPTNSGKTNLAANACYWGIHKPAKKADVPAREIQYWESVTLFKILAKAEKRGLTLACEEAALDVEKGADLEDKIAHLEPKSIYDTLLILSNFNSKILHENGVLNSAQEYVMSRYLENKITWILSTNKADEFKLSFPNLSSHVFTRPDWIRLNLNK